MQGVRAAAPNRKEDRGMKLVYLLVPPPLLLRNWGQVIQHFSIVFGDRINLSLAGAFTQFKLQSPFMGYLFY